MNTINSIENFYPNFSLLQLDWFPLHILFPLVKDILTISLVCKDYAFYVQKNQSMILKNIIYHKSFLLKDTVKIDELYTIPSAKYLQYVEYTVNTLNGFFCYYGNGIWKILPTTKKSSLIQTNNTSYENFVNVRFYMKETGKEVKIISLSAPIIGENRNFLGVTSDGKLIKTLIYYTSFGNERYHECVFMNPDGNKKYKKIIKTVIISDEKTLVYALAVDDSIIKITIIKYCQKFIYPKQNLSLLNFEVYKESKNNLYSSFFVKIPSYLKKISSSKGFCWYPDIIYISDVLLDFTILKINNYDTKPTKIVLNIDSQFSFINEDKLKRNSIFLVTKDGSVFIEDKSKDIEIKKNRYYISIVPFFNEKIIGIYDNELRSLNKKIFFLTENANLYHYSFLFEGKKTQFFKLDSNVVSVHEVSYEQLCYIKTDGSTHIFDIYDFL